MYPGFEVSEHIVGKKISFDTIRLEPFDAIQARTESEIPATIQLTEESIDDIRCILGRYYEKNPEIEDLMIGGGESFRFVIKKEDIEPVINMVANNLVLHIITSAFIDDDPADLEIDYSEVAIEDLDCEIEDPSWSQLSDTPVDVNEAINDQIPSGPEFTSISKEKYRDFVFDTIYPIINGSDWPEGAAWSINLALHELRKGRYDEAAYAFDAVRNSITKSPTPVKDIEISDLLNRYLVSLRDLALHQSESDYNLSNMELYYKIEERPYVLLSLFSSEPDYYDKHFRMSSSTWIANALVFVAAVATALGAPTISRAEVDPFGTDMTHRNESFVLRSAQNLLEIYDEDRRPKAIEHLDYIDFEKFAPETILQSTFESLGYTNIGPTDDGFEYKSTEYEFEPDLALEKDEELYIVYYRHSDPFSLAEEIDSLEQDITLILVSDQEFGEDIFSLTSDYSSVELFYLDSTEGSIRTADSGLPIRGSRPITNSGVRERLKELYEAAGECKNSQEKGNLLEEFCNMLFGQLIDDTEVLRMNAETDIEEIDLVLRNNQENHPWKNLSQIIMVECKNWSSPTGASVVRDFYGKADSLGNECSTGILICWSGITGQDSRKGAKGAIRDKKRDGFNILQLDKEDIIEAVESSNPSTIFDDQYVDLISEY